jgi:hypothetical protein
MSFIDSVLSNTVGVAYRAYTGNVDPWTKQQIVDDTAAGIHNASLTGGVDPLTGELIGYAVDSSTAAAQANQIVTQTLVSDNADPSQSTLGPRIPGLGQLTLPTLDKLVNGALVIGALVLGFYLYQAYGSKVMHAFRRR